MIVPVVPRLLPDGEAVLARDVQELDVEPKSLHRQAREHDFSGPCGETLQTRLGVEDSRQESMPDRPVEGSAYHMAGEDVTKEHRADIVSRFGKDAAGDDDVAPRLELPRGVGDIVERVREIGVREDPKAPRRGLHAARDREPFAAVAFVDEQLHTGRALREFAQQGRGEGIAAIVHEHELSTSGLPGEPVAQLRQSAAQQGGAVVDRDDQREWDVALHRPMKWGSVSTVKPRTVLTNVRDVL